MYKDALEQFAQASKLSDNHPAITALYGHALALSGDTAGARRALADLQRLSKTRYVSAFYFSGIYTGLGEKNTPMDWLDKTYKKSHQRVVRSEKHPAEL